MKFHLCKYTFIVIFICRFLFIEQPPTIVSNTVLLLVKENLTICKREGAFWPTSDMTFYIFNSLFYSISFVKRWVVEDCNTSLMLALISSTRRSNGLQRGLSWRRLCIQSHSTLTNLYWKIYFTAISLARLH